MFAACAVGRFSASLITVFSVLIAVESGAVACLTALNTTRVPHCIRERYLSPGAGEDLCFRFKESVLNSYFLYVRTLRYITCYLVIVLSGIYFGVLLHMPLYNAGGFGTDLPLNLLAWIIALIMMAGIWLCVPWRRLRITTPFIWILSGAVLLNLPLFWTPRETWLQARLPSVLGMWGAVLLYFTLLQCRFSRKQCQWLLYIVALSAVAEGGIVLLDIYAGGLPVTFTRALLQVNGRNGFGSFQQMNVTASFMATGLVLSQLLLSRCIRCPQAEPDTRLPWMQITDALLVLSLFILCVALVLLQSRTGWAGAGVGYLLVNGLLWRRKDLCRVRRAALWWCPVMGVMAGLFLLHLPGAPCVDHAESNFQRWLTLKATWDMILEAPVQGWGMGSFSYSFQHWMAAQPGGNPGRELMLHPHNEILYQWMEGGIVALLGCILIAAGGVSLVRRYAVSFIPAGWVALLPVVIHTQTEFPLYYSAPHVLALILILVCVDTGEPRIVDLRHRQFSLLAGKTAILLLCAYFVFLLACSMKVGFILSRYESQVPGARAEMHRLSGVPWLYHSRYDYDRNTLLLADFNATRDPVLLSRFLTQNARWLRERISPDAAFNQILVLHYLRRDDEGKCLFRENQQLFPWDRRFGHGQGASSPP